MFSLVCQVSVQSWEGIGSDCSYVSMKMIWNDSITSDCETHTNRCCLLCHRKSMIMSEGPEGVEIDRYLIENIFFLESEG